MSYVSITEEQQKEMLDAIGVEDISLLFKDIPEEILLDKKENIIPSLSEIETSQKINKIKDKNKVLSSFIGGGLYNHYIPPVVDHIACRSEFYTAYTPYQPEVSQGTLTAIFEFQSMICRLTGMDVANASMYDGATALAESILMSVRDNKKKKVLISDTLNNRYSNVLKTYAWASDIELVTVKSNNGEIDIVDLEKKIDGETSAFVYQNPNFFGVIEDASRFVEIVHLHKANIILTVTEALSLSLLKNPSEFSVDIVCGEAQSFGNPIAFGGPLLGFIAAKNKFLRKIPGRIVGKTEDLDGKEAYVLTLQTREQHIRRNKATSNICSNEGLCLLRAVIYLSLYGNKLRDLAIYNNKLAQFFQKKLQEKGFSLKYNKSFFNEFLIEVDNATALKEKLLQEGIDFGIKIDDNLLLISVTENNSMEEITNLLAKL